MMVKNNVPFLDSVAPYIGAGKGLVSVFRLALASFVSNNPQVFCRNHICDIRLLDGLSLLLLAARGIRCVFFGENLT
jgi:hypothetical protein